MKILKELVVNGTIWNADRPWCFTVIAQYIYADKWMLMSAPLESTSGGTCQMPHTLEINDEWTYILTHEQVCERLELWRAKKLDKILRAVDANT